MPFEFDDQKPATASGFVFDDEQKPEPQGRVSTILNAIKGFGTRFAAEEVVGMDARSKRQRQDGYDRSNAATQGAIQSQTNQLSDSERALLEQGKQAQQTYRDSQNSIGVKAVDLIRDQGLGFVKGAANTAVKLPLALGGIAEDATGTRSALESVGYRSKDALGVVDQFGNWLESLKSDAGQGRDKQFENTRGATATLLELGANPKMVMDKVSESLFGVGAIGKTAGAAVAQAMPKLIAMAEAKGLTGAAAEEFITNAATKIAQIAAPVSEGAQSGLDIAGTAQQHGRTLDQYGLPALAAAAGTALIGYGSNKLGAKAGIGDIETDIALRGTRSTAAKSGPGGFAERVIKEGAKEGLIEEGPQSVGESAAENVAMGRPWDQGIGKSVVTGAVTGGAMGGAHASIGGHGETVPPAAPAAAASPDPAPVAPQPKPAVIAAQEVAKPAAKAPETSAAEKALLAPVELTTLDRVNEIDKEDRALRARADELNKPGGGYGPMFDQERNDLAEQQQELASERSELTKGWPKAVPGTESSFTTEAGARVNAQYALMDAGDLITSHDEGLRKNPLYPPELQPRERDRAASEMQVSGIVQKLDPARLGLSADAANGAPIVGADGLVESGNARTIALKRVYQANGQKAADYKQWLIDNAQQFGITSESVNTMAKPVLVRVRTTPVNRAEFARQANASTVAMMSPSEQAKSDANRIDTMEDLTPDDNGDFSNAASRPFVRRFMARLPMTEQAGMIDSSGNLSTSGYARVRNAVLAKAYGDSPVLARMTESMDDNLRNVSRALMLAAPKVAQMRQAIKSGDRFDADITPDLMASVEELSKIKDDGGSVQDALAQTDIMGDQRTPEARQLLQFLNDNMRRPRRMADFIVAYMDALDAMGDPRQDSMFGDTQAPAKADLLTAAEKATQNEVQDSGPKGGGASQEAGAQAQRQPENAQGNRPGTKADGGGNGSSQNTDAKGQPDAEVSKLADAAAKDFKDALADLAVIASKHTRISIVPEDTPNLMPTMVKLSGAAIKLIGNDLKKVVRWVKAQLKAIPEFKTFWNEIDNDLYMKAALRALEGMEKSAQKGLFDTEEKATEIIQRSIFDAPIDEPSKPKAQAQDDGEVGLKIALDLAKKWQDGLGDKVQVVMGGSLISGTFVQTGNDPIDMDVRFLSDNPESAIADVERVTGLKLRKTIQASNFPIGTSTAYMIEGFLNIDGKTIEVEGSLRSKAYVGWANYYRKVFTPKELADFRADKLRLKGDKKAYKARKNQMLETAQARAIARGLVPDLDYQVPESWKQPGGKLVDENGFERGVGLNSLERFAEQKFYDELHADMDGQVNTYLQEHFPIVDADVAKELSPIYEESADYANAVHEPSSLVSKRAWVEALRRYEGDTVILTAGGAGSGKSFSGKLVKEKLGLPLQTLTFDSALTSPNAADSRIQEAIDAGKKVVVIYTNTDAEMAFGWSLTRPRLMKAAVVASSHTRAAENIKRLEKLHKGSENVQVVVVNDPGEQSLTNIGKIDDVAAYDYNQLERKFNEIARKELGNGGINRRKFEFVTGIQTLGNSSQREDFRVDGSRNEYTGDVSGQGQAAGGIQENLTPPRATSEAGSAGTEVLNANDSTGQGSTQGQSAQPVQTTAGKRKAERVRDGSGGSDLFGSGVDDATGPNQREVGQPGSDGLRQQNESGRKSQSGNGTRADAGVPAGRDIPAKSGLNYQFGADDLTYEGSWVKKAEQNIEAVELLRKLETEARQATPDEQKILAKFVGWGASELANNLFGSKLDKHASTLEDYKKAVAALDKLGRDHLNKGGMYRGSYADDGYYQARNVLAAAGKIAQHAYPDRITRAELAAVKPDASTQRWLELRDRLRALMDTKQMAQGSKSTQYAHYTSKAVVSSMWKAMERMGFNGGTILEPGAGIGVFPGLMPQAMATNSIYTGIEFDSVTGGILKQLFPDERILVESFMDSKLPKNFYDVAIGNPPFQAKSAGILSDPEYSKHAFALHDYFFAKSIDRVKPGGLVVYVTSRYTMDKLGDKARKYLADRADLVGAIRLPQTAFKQNAGTEVVTDVIFLRKKVKGETFEHAQPWMGLAQAKAADGSDLTVSAKEGDPDQPALINEYFAAHPEMVLGHNSNAGSLYKAKEYTVTPFAGDIEEHFAKAVENLPANIYHAQRGSSAEAAKVREIDFNPKAKKEGNYYVSDSGVLMQRESGVGQRVELKNPKDVELVKDFVPLRDALKQAHYDQLNNGDWETSLKALQKAYDAFTKKNGAINQSTSKTVKVKTEELDEDGNPTGNMIDDEEVRRSFPLLDKLKDDPDWTLVAALEEVNGDTGEVTRSKFLDQRVLGMAATVQAGTPTDALLTTLNDLGRVDMAVIAQRIGLTEQETIEALGSAVYDDPEQGWTTADDYLSGNVKRKLELARSAAKSDRRYQRNVTALEAHQPEPLTPSQISPRLGMNWIPGDVYAQFMREKVGLDMSMEWEPRTRSWHFGWDSPETHQITNRWGRVEKTYKSLAGAEKALATMNKGYDEPRYLLKAIENETNKAALEDWGTPNYPAQELMENAITGAPVKVYSKDEHGKPYLDAALTEAAGEKLKKLHAEFESWVFSEPNRSDRLVQMYNDKFNTTVARSFDGSHLTLPGASMHWQKQVHAHVKRGVWRIVQTGNTYLAHAVGSGKTAQMVMSAMEQKRLGLIKKPMIVVPNHMLKQFASEWLDIYPAARLMVADEHNFHTDNRRRFVSRVALSDLDGVVITHSAFKLLDLDPDFKIKMIEEQLAFFRAALEEAGGDPDKLTVTEETDAKGKTKVKVKGSGSQDPKIKRIEAQIENMEQKLHAAMSSEGKDKNVRFDELGVDFLYVDEAHEFRKLDFTTVRDVKGLSPQGSGRAFDLFMKSRYLESKTPGRSMVMASGTPVTNTVAELYSVQKMLGYQALVDKGLEDFDSWASMFGREKTSLEPDASGRYENVTRFNDFVNIPEMTQMFREFADVLTADYLAEKLGDKRPKVEGGSRTSIITPETAEYDEFRSVLESRMKVSKAWKPSKDEPNNPDPIIRIIGDGRLAAIDMRFMDPRLPSNPDSKLNSMIDGVIAAWKETADQEYTGKDGKVEPTRGSTMMVFSDLGFGAGVAASRGFSARAWMEKRLRDAGIPMNQVAFMSDYKKSSAKLKLFSDVNAGRIRLLVGSSKSMGTGVNAQQRLKDLFHLDSPWFPADLEQREGRIVRQGNKNKTVRIKAYAAKGTYDEQMWGQLANKQLFIDKAMSGDPNVRSIEDAGAADMMAIMAGMVAKDPRVLKLAGLETDINKLHRLYQAHEDTRASYRQRFQSARSTVEWNEKRLPAADKAASTVQDLAGDKFAAKVGGSTFTERTKWAEALIAKYKDLTARGETQVQKVGEISGFAIAYGGETIGGQFYTKLMLDTPTPIELVTHAATSAMGIAMRAQNAVTEVARLPALMRDRINEARSTMDSLSTRMEASFPMSELLAQKISERNALRAEMAAPSFEQGPDLLDSPSNWFDDFEDLSLEDYALAGVVGMVGRKPVTRLSRGSGGGMDVKVLEALATRIKKRMPNMPKVHVLASPADKATPKSLRDYIEKQGAMNDVDGALHRGELYLFASGLPDALRAEHVLAEHEAAHFGLRAILGDSLKTAMRAIYNNNAAVRQAATELQKRGKLSNAEATEEVIVDIPSSQLVKLKGWRKVVLQARDWLADHGFDAMAAKLSGWLDGSLTDQQRADLMVASLVRGARAYMAGKRGARASIRPDDTMLSGTLAEDAAKQEQWLSTESRARGYADIDELAEKNYPLFEKLAELWRKKNPAENGVLLSRSPMKSVAANIDRGLNALANAITGKTTVHRAMYRNGLGWVDFVWGDEGRVKPSGKTVGAKGLSHILEARMRKDGLTESKAIEVLGELVRTIASGTEFDRKVFADVIRAGIKHDGFVAWLAKRPGANSWIVTGYEVDPDKEAAGRATATSTTSVASRTRDGEGAGSGESLTALSRAGNQGTAAERADKIIQTKAATAKPIDALAKGLTRITGVERLTRAIYSSAGFLLDKYTPEAIKAGMISDYGVPEAVIDQRAMMQGRQRVQLRQAGSLIEKLATLTRAESRIAYEWMNETDPHTIYAMMQNLPEESVKVLQEVQQMIDRLSLEAVRMGQLTQEAYDRNRFAYLRRSYAKYTLNLTAGEKAGRARAISILGDQYKGRGLTESATMTQIQNSAPDWWKRKVVAGKADTSLKGQKFLRLERHAPSGQRTTPLPGMDGKQLGKLKEVHYFPADEKLPAKYADWTPAGTFEVRDTKGGNVILWRDFTKYERETMGEIDEARFAIAKTLHGMIHDVEVGRYLEWLAHKYAKKEGETIPGKVVDASERYSDTFSPGEWVKVPDTTIPGTSVKKYGKLSGRYLPGPVWNDLRQTVNGQFKPFGATYAKILAMWKASKTALSPAVHTNNIMSNFVMADWHDVTAGHTAKALRLILGAHSLDGQGALGRAGNVAARTIGTSDREAAREVLNRYLDSGGNIGSWATNEVANKQIEPLLATMEAELAATAGQSQAAQVGVMAALHHAILGRLPSAIEALKGSKPGKVIGTEASTLMELYQNEDEVFRLASWLKAKEEGKTDMEAGKIARRSFMDYHINAPWVQAMRNSALPFVSYTYRAVPMMLEIAATKPHKLMKLMMFAGALNALGVMLAGGDDDKERKLLPEEKAGRIWGLVPKLIRMPWNDAHASPVYLDIRRFIPVGDVFDVGSNHAAIPMLPMMNPGGPLAIIAEIVLNKTGFTGKPITLETDTVMQQTAKVMDYLYKSMMPNVLGLPGTYASTGVFDAAKGKTDAFGREQSVTQAVASAFGVKLGSYPGDVLRKNEFGKAQALMMEIDRNISLLKRQHQNHSITDAEFQEKVQVEVEKKRKVQQDLAKKLGG